MIVTYTKAAFRLGFSQPTSIKFMNTNVQQRVLKVIAEVLNRKENEIRLDASLRDDLQASSLDQMTIYIALEDEFQRNMPPEEVTELVSIKDIIDLVDRKLQESPST
jgi:acyl carrier protein